MSSKCKRTADCEQGRWHQACDVQQWTEPFGAVMPKRTTTRLIRKATLPLWKRDQLEMRAIDTLLAVFEPKRRPRARAAARPRAIRRPR